MPSSTICTFTEPDAYFAAIRAQRVDGVVTARGDFRAELARTDLHRRWMQRGEESLPGSSNSRRARIVLQFSLPSAQISQ